MLKILYKNGCIDGNTFELDPDIYLGQDALEASDNEEVQALVAGRLATIGTDGYVELADGNPLGVIVNDAEGRDLYNKPALASGKVPVMFGGGLVETDQVVEDNIAIGDKLYCGTGDNKGLWTKTASDGAEVIGVAVSANSASDKTVKIQSRV